MSPNHNGGNAVPEITKEEHQGDINAKRISMVNSLSAFGDLRTVELSPLIQFSFEYTVSNTLLTTSSVDNDGTITQADAMAIATTSTTQGGVARMICHQHARYKAGLGGVMRFTSLFTPGVADTSQWVGILGPTGSTADFVDGFAVGYDGADFGIVRFQNDAKFFTALSDCDDPLDGTGTSGMTLDPTKLNIFFIQYQYLGAGAVHYWVERETGEMTLFHTIKYANLNTVPSIYNPNLHLTLYANNKTTTSNLITKTGSMAYFVEGRVSPTEIHQFTNSSGRRSKSSVTSEVALFTIRNKSTYASKTNLISIHILRLSLGIDASAVTNLGQYRLIKNTTLGGTPSYSDISTTDSLVDIDTSGTTVTGGITIFTGDLAGQNDKISENMSDYKIFLHPGETLTVAVQSTNSATFNGSLMWRELF